MVSSGAVYHIVPASGPWGEYSAVLIHGIASWFERGISGELLLERTGPFVPPMTFPSRLGPVITNALKRDLESSGLTGFSFLPVIKKHIVRSRWHEWDITAAEPRRYPRGGKPDNYVLGRTHDPQISSDIGDLWELRPEEDATADLFRRPGSPDLFASARAKRSLEPHTGDWVRFDATS